MKLKFKFLSFLFLYYLLLTLPPMPIAGAAFAGKDAYIQTKYGDIMSLSAYDVFSGNNVWFDETAKTINYNGAPLYSRAKMSMSSWNETRASVNLSETNIFSNSKIRVYSVYSNYSYSGMARPVDLNGKTCADDQGNLLDCDKRWSYVKVWINHNSIAKHNSQYKESDPNYADYNAVWKVISHEFGHALGLAHQPKEYKSIMQTGLIIGANRYHNAKKLDLDNLLIAYPILISYDSIKEGLK